VKQNEKVKKIVCTIMYGILIVVIIFLPIVIFLISMGIIENGIKVTLMWRNIIAIIGCICMIISTVLSIGYRHRKGSIYTFKNASTKRVVGISIFIGLLTIYLLYMVISGDCNISEALGIGILFYLGGILCFKYMRVTKFNKDYYMILILMYLSFTARLVLKCIQVWFDLGIRLDY
jgi:hypothetical protein